ncbi:MAG: hypothetical protein AAGA18_12345 [Verrucomicrobiota bacterium]
MKDLLGEIEKLKEVDRALSSICANCPYLSDDILEFRYHVHQKSQPGKCVRAYFDFASSDPEKPEVCCIRQWLETSVEVEAIDLIEQKKLESFPFKTSNDRGIEDYCIRVMQDIHHDRAYETNHIKLQFRYCS